MVKLGIDLNESNGSVAMQAVKNREIDFVMIRSSWEHYGEDTQFRSYVAKWKYEAVGRLYGFYHYAYALRKLKWQ